MTTPLKNHTPGRPEQHPLLWVLSVLVILCFSMIVSVGNSSADSSTALAQAPAKNRLVVNKDVLGPPAPPLLPQEELAPRSNSKHWIMTGAPSCREPSSSTPTSFAILALRSCGSPTSNLAEVAPAGISPAKFSPAGRASSPSVSTPPVCVPKRCANTPRSAAMTPKGRRSV